MRRHTGGTVAVLAGALIASTHPATAEAAPAPTLPTPSVGVSLPRVAPPSDPAATATARSAGQPQTTPPELRATTTRAVPASPGRSAAATDARRSAPLSAVPAGAADGVTASPAGSPTGTGATTGAGGMWLAILAGFALLAAAFFAAAAAGLIRRDRRGPVVKTVITNNIEPAIRDAAPALPAQPLGRDVRPLGYARGYVDGRLGRPSQQDDGPGGVPPDGPGLHLVP